MSIGRKGKSEVSPTGAVVLLVLLAGFLLFILSLPQDYRDATLDRIESATPEVLFQLTPGEVRTETGASSTTRYDFVNFKLDSEMSSIDSVLSSNLANNINYSARNSLSGETLLMISNLSWAEAMASISLSISSICCGCSPIATLLLAYTFKVTSATL